MTEPIERRPAPRPAPRYGGLKGKIWMSDDWDQWSEEELALFEAPIDPDERDAWGAERRQTGK